MDHTVVILVSDSASHHCSVDYKPLSGCHNDDLFYSWLSQYISLVPIKRKEMITVCIFRTASGKLLDTALSYSQLYPGIQSLMIDLRTIIVIMALFVVRL